MVRTMQAKAPSSAVADGKKKVLSGLMSFDKQRAKKSKPTISTSTSRRRASLSQCKSASLRLFRRVAEEERAARVNADDAAAQAATPVVRLSQRAHDHVSFLIRNMEQQLFGQCRKLMRTRTMSPKLLTASIFMGFDKDLAKEAAKQAFHTRTRMDELDREFEAQSLAPRKIAATVTATIRPAAQ